MITDIFFFPNGGFLCCDEKMQQVPEHQANLLCLKLQELLKAKVITGDTRLEVLGHSITVKEYVNMVDL